jgi:hypothetical protein
MTYPRRPRRTIASPIRNFADWANTALERPAEIGDLVAGTVEAFLAHRKSNGSAQCARSAWVALRSVARFLAERRIHHERIAPPGRPDA